MKRNIFIRILAALSGLLLWVLGGLALAETFFHVPVTAFVGKVLGARTPLTVLLTLLAALILFGLGLCCMLMLSGKRAEKRKGFVMQKGENGAIGVSIKSIEGLVQTCVKQHDVIASAEISVVERRDGIVILLGIEEAAGVNIPLAVGALQKQIKQYVGTCTGVDVHEVRVMVESNDTRVESPYTVETPVLMTTAATAAEIYHEAPVVVEPVMEAPVLEAVSMEEVAPEAVPVVEAPVMAEPVEIEEPVQETAPVVSIPVMPVIPEIIEEEDDRPLHQRIFGAEEQPVFVPAPPELVIEPAAEEVAEAPVAEVAEEIADAAAEAEEAEEEIDANAVLEVVAAIAMEEEMPQDEYESADEGEYDEEVLAEEASLDGDTDELKTEDREI